LIKEKIRLRTKKEWRSLYIRRAVLLFINVAFLGLLTWAIITATVYQTKLEEYMVVKLEEYGLGK
jgi:hypothetical protein